MVEYYGRLICKSGAVISTSPRFGTREETNYWVSNEIKNTKLSIAHVEIHMDEFNDDDLLVLQQVEYFYEW